MVSGGPELSGAGHMMVCNGSVWKSIVDFDATANGTLPYALSLSGDLTTTQITANQNDYNPANLATASVLRLSSDASRNITSLAGGADGRIITVMNVGTNPIVLKNDDGATGTAANRFALTGDLTLAAKQSAMLMYDSTSFRWRQIANSIDSGGGSTSIDSLTDAVTDYTTDHNMRLGSNTAPVAGAINNVFVGEGAGATGTNTADYNTALGYSALNSNTSGASSTAIGTFALRNATSGSYNVALGMNALGAATVTGSSNTALGAGTLYYTTYGGFNVAIGQDAMLYNDTGNANIAVGFESLWGAHTSANNVAIGWKAARQIVGNDNVVIGNDAGHNNTDATVGKNVIIGALAGNSIATGGDNNIMVGWGAGGTTTTGANNILIGYDIQAATATTSNYLNIGNAITGDLSISYVNMNGGLALKTDISPAQITTNQNDYNPTGLATASVLRLTASTSVNITGLAGGADGRVLTLLNIGPGTITVSNQSASSAAANRFAFSKNISLAADQSIGIIYDSTSQRWRAAGVPFDLFGCSASVRNMSWDGASTDYYIGSLRGVWSDGAYIYAVNNALKIEAYTFNGSTWTAKASSGTTTSQPNGIWGGPNTSGAGAYVYVAAGATGVEAFVYNTGANTWGSPVTYNTTGTATGVWSNGSYIFVADGASGVEAFTFNGTAWTLGGSATYNTPGTATNVWGDGTYIYVADGASGLRALTWNGTAWTSVATLAGGNTQGVWGDGTYIYVTDGYNGMSAYTFNGTTFTLRGTYNADPGGDWGVWANNGYVYVLAGAITALKFDGTAFTVQGYFPQTGQGAVGVWADSNYLYFLDGYDGLMAYQVCK